MADRKQGLGVVFHSLSLCHDSSSEALPLKSSASSQNNTPILGPSAQVTTVDLTGEGYSCRPLLAFHLFGGRVSGLLLCVPGQASSCLYLASYCGNVFLYVGSDLRSLQFCGQSSNH